MTYHLLLGGNEGDVRATMARAIEHLSECGHIVGMSDAMETEPWGMPPNTPKFVNQAVALTTNLDPFSLMAFTQHVERLLGRTEKTMPGMPYGNRPIDIDILLAGSRRVNTAVLTIPHCLLAERKFALEPLAQIAPNVVVPTLNRTVGQLLTELNEREIQGAE